MSINSVLVVGSIAIDWLELPDGRKGEVLGGSTTYFLLSSRFLARIHVVGIIGSDFPENGKKIFRDHAANLEDLQTIKGKTFRWGGRYHADWEDRTTLYTELGVFEQFKPVLSKENRKCPTIFLGNIHPSLQLDVLKQIEHGDKRIICDTMNLWIETTHEDLLEVLQRIDILLLNESEASLLTGISNLVDAAHRIREMGPEHVVVKQGPKGAILVSELETIHTGVFPVDKVIDPTGAGDSFAGGFVGSLARGDSLSDALVWGSAVGSFCVEGFGINGLQNISVKKIQERVDFIREHALN